MLKTNRRGFLAAGAALPVSSAAATALPKGVEDRVAADLAHYIGFGSKQAGGPGDNACGEWMAAELEAVGFKVDRQEILAPFFIPHRAELVCGATTAPVWPQPIVRQTGSDGLSGKLVRIDAATIATTPLKDAIALLELPYARWSTALAKPVREPITAAFAAGAKAVAVITNGPTGKVIALNADGRAPMFAGPVALLAPQDARPFLTAAAAGETATLHVTGESGRRSAFNFIGRIDRGKPKWVIVSTPRSGWYVCGGERGGGIAGWLALARWASNAITNYNLAFVCNTGHEYENLGAEEALKQRTPKPADTHFWLHLGANVASRDWHDLTGKPLPGTDSQRFLAVSPALLDLARETFAGQVGLEAPYSTKDLTAGELTEVVHAGYEPHAGVFGLHRYHHVADDDARCVSPTNVAKTIAAFQQLLERVAR